ncbi:MAG: cytochrome P450 [Chloroflexota bacterium]
MSGAGTVRGAGDGGSAPDVLVADAPLEWLLYDLHAASAVADPYPLYARLRAEHPLWLNPASGAWMVSTYADVDRILRDPAYGNARIEELVERLPPGRRHLADPLRPLLDARLVLTDGDRHRRIRRLVMQGFTGARIDVYAPTVRRIAGELIDRLPEDVPVDLVPALTGVLPGLVILSLLGIDMRSEALLKAWTDTFYRWLAHAPGSIEDRTTAAVDATERTAELLRAELARVRGRPMDGLLGALAAARDADDLLDDGELVANVIGIVNAGQETTTCLLANGIHRLLEHPGELARLRADPALLPTAVEEILRYDAPAQTIARIVVAETELAGITLDPGTLVGLGLAAANRDPAAFPDPDRFDVGRTPNRHLSFGLGPHFCVGNGLARREGEIVLELLLARFPTIEPAWDPAVGPPWRPSLAFRAPAVLPVILRR